MKKLQLLLIVISHLNIYSQVYEEPPLVGNKTIKSLEYELEYFSAWKVLEKHNGADFYILSQKMGENDFIENINLIVQDISALNLDLDGFTALSESQIKSNNANLLSSIRGRGYQELLFEAKFQNFECQFLQRYYIRNNRAYILTFSAEKSAYERYKKLAMPTFESFKLF